MLSSKWWNNKASDIKLVSLYSTIKIMHDPINVRVSLMFSIPKCSIHIQKQQCSVKHNNHIVCYLLTLGDMFRFLWNHHQALSEKNTGPLHRTNMWPCIVSKLWSERENQQDARVRCLFLTISQHVSGIIMPIFMRTRRMLLHVVCCAVTWYNHTISRTLESRQLFLHF